MLPSEKPAHELRGRDGLNLPSSRPDRQFVDALQDTALTPLNLVVVCCSSVFKTAPHQKALGFKTDELLKNVPRVEREVHGELMGRDRSENLDPPLDAPSNRVIRSRGVGQA